MKTLLILSILTNIFIVSFFVYRRLSRKVVDTRTPYQIASTAIFKTLPKDTGAVFFIGNSLIRDYPVEEIFNAKNRGVGGSWTFDTYKRLDDVLACRPSKIFVLEGINDIRDGVPLDSSVAEYEKIIEKLKGTNFYVISILPIYSRHELLPLIQKFNDEIKKMTPNFIDVFDQMSNPNFYYDGVHMNEKGYGKMTELLTPYVKGVTIDSPAYSFK